MTQILFELYDVLVDKMRLRLCAIEQVGLVMAERFGGDASAWTAAQRRIVDDWDSYYADLDLNGEHGLDNLREGQIRTTRALFRITNTAEPDSAALFDLAQQLPYLVSRRCDALYADVKPVLAHLYEAGYTLGIASHATTAHARGMLEGGGIATWFAGKILGPDVTEHFIKNQEFFRAAGSDSIVVDAQEASILGAQAVGMRAVQLIRDTKPPSPHADYVLHGSLDGLLDYLGLTAGFDPTQ